MAETLTTLAKRLRPLLLSVAQSAANAVITAGEGPGIDIANNLIGLGGDTILLYKANGNPAAEFAKTASAAALAAAAAGDVIILPPCSISGDLTIPAGVAVVGIGRNKCTIVGKVSLAAGAEIENLTIAPTGNSPSVIIGVSGPASGESHVYNCSIAPTNSGTGGVHAADVSSDGLLYCHNCLLDGRNVAVGAVGYAGYLAPLAIGALYVVDGCMAFGSDPDNPFNE